MTQSIRPMRLLLLALALLLSCREPFSPDESVPLSGKLDQYFTYLAGKKNFHGVVLIARRGQVLLNKGYGRASDERKLPMQSTTVLDIGSVTKPFTATAIVQLMANGQLTPQSKLANFFPAAPPDKKTITLHQLLTHTSGLEADFAGELEELSKEASLQKVLQARLVHAPGSKYEYSNTGYAVLGFIIEKVTGQPYHQYLRDSVFTKAGMPATGFYGDSLLQAHLYFTGYANGIKTDFATLSPAVLYGNTFGNGGILSTTADLFAFTEAVTGNLLNQQSRQKMFTDYVNQYGYGWEVRNTAYGKLYAHNGGGLGGNAYLAIYPDQEIVIIVLSNRITLRTAFGLPVKVSLPADEAGKQIMENIMQDDFSTMPLHTFPGGRW